MLGVPAGGMCEKLSLTRCSLVLDPHSNSKRGRICRLTAYRHRFARAAPASAPRAKRNEESWAMDANEESWTRTRMACQQSREDKPGYLNTSGFVGCSFANPDRRSEGNVLKKEPRRPRCVMVLMVPLFRARRKKGTIT